MSIRLLETMMVDFVSTRSKERWGIASGIMVGAWMMMPEHLRAELEEWERGNVGANVGTSDWPGWQRLFGFGLSVPPIAEGDRGKSKAGYVYILRGERGLYKIGRSRAPVTRASQLAGQVPFVVEVVHVIACDNAREAEAVLHARYDGDRERGEWFHLSSEAAEAISELGEYQCGQFIGQPES